MDVEQEIRRSERSGERSKGRVPVDFGSPNAFLCHRVIPAIEARTGIQFQYVPILLGGISRRREINHRLGVSGHSQQTEYQRLEVERFVRKHGIDDLDTRPIFRSIRWCSCEPIAARTLGVFDRYVEAMFHHNVGRTQETG